jgi:GAF domain-containing protein
MGRRAKPAKTKVEAKRPPARKSPKNERSRVRDLEKRLAEALKGKAEAQEQQAATAEILQAMRRSPADTQPVFDAIVSAAARLLRADGGILTRVAGELIELAAFTSSGPAGDEGLKAWFPVSVHGTGSMQAMTVRGPAPFVSTDFGTDERLNEGTRRRLAARGFRSGAAVPLIDKGISIGALSVTRRDPGAFAPGEIALLQTFADQAVIAIANVRLFNETKEALEQQTATSEILRIISSSPTDLQPVLDAVSENAARVCEASDAEILLVEGTQLRAAAHHGQAFAAAVDRPVTRDGVAGRAVIDRATIHLPDVLVADDFPLAQRLSRADGSRTVLATPLIREAVAVGAILIRREEVRPFSDKQIALLQTFADQAVIAIENVRLFKELQEKNEALTQAHAQVTEALEQQTATSEILRTIAHSQTDVQPVFGTIVHSAVRLLRGYSGTLTRVAGGQIELAAFTSTGADADAALRASYPRSLESEGTLVMAIRERVPLNVATAQTDPRLPQIQRTFARVRGFQSLAAVPLLRHDEAVGAILVTRREPGGFTDDEIALLKTFADQAVIAIENARLLRELQARTQELTRSVEQLTALGDVGRAVSSTLDLETVLTTIVARAVELSGLDGGVVFEYDEATEEFIQRVATETGGALAEVRRTTRFRKGEGVLGRTAITLEPVQVPDITIPGAYESRLRENLIASGIRAILAVPMVREDRLIGCLAVTRNHPGEFPSGTIELLRTFATQSALAIQNARLFREIEEKSRQLEAASQHKSEFLANMSHELRTPLNAIIGFSEVLTDRMFGDLNEKQEEYLKDIYASGTHLLSLINDILDLSKIEAGRMELELTDFHLPTALDNALTLVRERAGRRSITLQMSVDDRLDQIQADERKIRQVALNLLSNAIKFTPEGGRIEVAAMPKDGSVEVSVSDTGVGIAREDQEAVFEEFRQVGTAERKAEGTGLGLTLCRKFVELHGGRIWVTSKVGAGSTFTFTIPVRHNE